MSDFEIEEAKRESAPITAAFIGQSGTGKTYSALLFARGLVGPKGKIVICDTEGRRALDYADDSDIGGFQHMDFQPPYSPDRCMKALDAAVAAGANAVILDSASLEHDGEGGMLDMAEKEAERLFKKNPNNRNISMQKWTVPKLAHKRFLYHATGLPVHVIFCFRQTITTDFSVKPPVSHLTTVAEKNTKFEFKLHVEFDQDHKAKWTRIPKPFLPAIEQGKLITVDHGEKMASLIKGDPVTRGKAAETAPEETEEEGWVLNDKITELTENLALDQDQCAKLAGWATKGSESDLWSLEPAAAKKAIKFMEDKLAKNQREAATGRS